MRNNLTTAMIAIAQSNPSLCEKIASLLWDNLGKKVMDRAVALFYRVKPDFSLMGLETRTLREALSGDVYILFVDAIMDYDKTQNASFETFVTNRIYWKFVDDKCNNSERTDREKSLDLFMEENALTEDEALSMMDYNYGDICDFTNGVANSDNEVETTSWKEFMAVVESLVADKEALKQFIKAHLQTLEYSDRYEESETAERLSCTRATVYNRFKQIKEILVANGLDKEFLRLAA